MSEPNQVEDFEAIAIRYAKADYLRGLFYGPDDSSLRVCFYRAWIAAGAPLDVKRADGIWRSHHLYELSHSIVQSIGLDGAEDFEPPGLQIPWDTIEAGVTIHRKTVLSTR